MSVSMPRAEIRSAASLKSLTSAAGLAPCLLATRAIIRHMPAPTNERQALGRERAELPAHVANYRRELDATPQDNREHWERLEWQIRRVEKRMVEVRARLTGSLLSPKEQPRAWREC